jgi:hypothetical protein
MVNVAQLVRVLDCDSREGGSNPPFHTIMKIRHMKIKNKDVTYIRLYIEHKDHNDKWTVDREECKICRTNRKSDLNLYPEYCYGYQKCNGSNRLYPLFSILAHVRITHAGLNPISAPRGIPEDASDFYIRLAANSHPGNYSHSYHTLKQLKEYDGKWDSSEDPIYDWGHYLKHCLPSNLEELAQKHGGDDNVRIVFFFNN